MWGRLTPVLAEVIFKGVGGEKGASGVVGAGETGGGVCANGVHGVFGNGVSNLGVDDATLSGVAGT